MSDGAVYSQVVLNALRRFPDRTMFIQDEQTWTYRHMLDAIAKWVVLLQERGLQRGDGVGVLSPNRPEVWLTQTAVPFAGGRYTALHPLGSFDDHLYACDEAELKILFVAPTYAPRAAELLVKAKTLRHVITFGPTSDNIGEDLENVLPDVSSAGLDAGPHGPDDIAWLLYTGGTTGVPKAAMLSSRAIAQMGFSVAVGWDLPTDVRYLAAAPISHAAGMPILATLIAGGTTVLQPSFNAVEWMKAVTRHRITLSLLVPTMIYAVLDHPDLPTADLSSLETVLYGASPMSPTRLIEAIERIGPVFMQLYGQTECAGIATSMWRSQHDVGNVTRLTSCGTPMVGNRVEVLNEQHERVAVGQPGEICVMGPTVMQGYWKQPELTAATIVGGWLHTGDMATVDADGFLTIVDRKKDMIISGGFNVFPREIEDVISTDPGETVDAEAIRALVRDRKGPVYAPKVVEVVESLPLTAVGKPDKKTLRAKYWADATRSVN
jgi:fatty-acyl-CoA synthase